MYAITTSIEEGEGEEKSKQEKSISNEEKVKQLHYILFLRDTVKIQDLQ